MNKRIVGIGLLAVGSLVMGIMAGNYAFRLFDKTVPPAVMPVTDSPVSVPPLPVIPAAPPSVVLAVPAKSVRLGVSDPIITVEPSTVEPVALAVATGAEAEPIPAAPPPPALCRKLGKLLGTVLLAANRRRERSRVSHTPPPSQRLLQFAEPLWLRSPSARRELPGIRRVPVTG